MQIDDAWVMAIGIQVLVKDRRIEAHEFLHVRPQTLNKTRWTGIGHDRHAIGLQFRQVFGNGFCLAHFSPQSLYC